MARFARGAIPTPAHKLLAAMPHIAVKAARPQFTVVPAKLSYWDNERDGVCVSSEEAWAKAWWSTYCGLDEVFASESEVRNFAARHGWLNGAMLTEVMDVMISEGMSIGGQNYKDGKYLGVNYGDEAALQAALDPDAGGGPVKIAIDADALPQGAGNSSGWYATTNYRFRNTDHCVGLGGYGRADFLFDALKVHLPSALSPSTPGYHLFTWSTIGFVTHDWLMGTCTEAWVRNPTTPGQSPAPPVPPTPPTPPAPPAPATITIPSLPVYLRGLGLRIGYTDPAVISLQSAAAGAGISWIVILELLWKFGQKALPVILADIQAGKTLREIVEDLVAAFLPLQARSIYN